VALRAFPVIYACDVELADPEGNLVVLAGGNAT
jgi:hypothetical protein